MITSISVLSVWLSVCFVWTDFRLLRLPFVLFAVPLVFRTCQGFLSVLSLSPFLSPFPFLIPLPSSFPSHLAPSFGKPYTSHPNRHHPTQQPKSLISFRATITPPKLPPTTTQTRVLTTQLECLLSH